MVGPGAEPDLEVMDPVGGLQSSDPERWTHGVLSALQVAPAVVALAAVCARVPDRALHDRIVHRIGS